MVKSIKTVKGDILPIKDHVLVSDMEFAQLVTEGGIIIPGDEGSSRGIHPRWGKVYSVGPEQTEIKKGEWILVDHGRWTRGVTLVTDDGEELQVRRVDIKDILDPSGISNITEDSLLTLKWTDIKENTAKYINDIEMNFKLFT